MVVTQQFHETLEPLSEWLAATEKHLVHSEPIGTETSKLEEQISQHKVAAVCLSVCGSFLFRLVLLLHAQYCFLIYVHHYHFERP